MQFGAIREYYHGIMSVPQNIVMNLNHVMLLFSYGLTSRFNFKDLGLSLTYIVSFDMNQQPTYRGSRLLSWMDEW
jgi:hypothetical protein